MNCPISWEAIAGLSSALIALCALGFTYWQVCISRRYNKLSVIPYLTTWSNLEYEKGTYTVNIMNNGVGPALIKSFQIFVDGQKVDGYGLGLIEKALTILFPAHKYNSYKAFLSDGYMMASNEKRVLVSIQFVGLSYPKTEEIDQVNKRVKIVIDYESIYSEKHVYDSSKFKVIN